MKNLTLPAPLPPRISPAPSPHRSGKALRCRSTTVGPQSAVVVQVAASQHADAPSHVSGDSTQPFPQLAEGIVDGTRSGSRVSTKASTRMPASP